MAGAIICALKSRLDAAMASNLLRHSEAKIVFIDAALLGVAQEALRLMSVAGARAPVVVLIRGELSTSSTTQHDYEDIVSGGKSPEFAVQLGPVESALLCAANHALLTPISFLERAALVYPDRHTVVSATGDAPPRTWRETRDRCFRLAAALAGLGVQRRDVVAVFANNIPAMYELHFVVPMAGAIICALKSRLDAAMASNLLRHSEAKIVFIDAALLGVAQEALRLMSVAGARAPVVVLIRGELSTSSTTQHDYEDIVAVFANNIPAMYELHFVVPMAGAIICALKSRLDAAMASNLLRYSEAKIVFIDAALLGVAQEALRLMSVAGARAPVVVLIRGELSTSSTTQHDYEDIVVVFPHNIPAMYEVHFVVPIAGAIICALNSRLDAAMASNLLQHSEAKIVFIDAALLGVA
ncbi:hypothetical protein ACQ4PT_024134 [Festuca glaucescens]